MSSSAPRLRDIPSGLFEDEEEGSGERELAEDEDGPSAGFLALIGHVDARRDRRRGRSKTMAASVFSRALAEVDEMLRSGDWDGAGARHFVALYDRMHLRCYGVEPAELGPSERYQAMMLAAGMLKRSFGGDVVAMARYALWAWNREIGREEWRRRTKNPGGRLGVRLFFGGAILTDYRVSLARGEGRP